MGEDQSGAIDVGRLSVLGDDILDILVPRRRRNFEWDIDGSSSSGPTLR